MFFANSGLVKGITADAFHNTANDVGLRKVIETWHGRTGIKERTWKTLLDVAKKFSDHTLSKYLDNNGIPCKQNTVFSIQWSLLRVYNVFVYIQGMWYL